MSISEQQLETWSHIGSQTDSAKTYRAIRTILEDSTAPYAARNFEIYLQGSYGNDTNIYADSDVDVVMCLNSVYYFDLQNLNEDEKAKYERDRNPESYKFSDFKKEVADWLAKNFVGATAGNKAIFVPGNNSRRDCDVLACVEHRRYQSYDSPNSFSSHDGICFWSGATKITNYPKQHSANCTTKHQATGNLFKPCVRILKNMRNTMIDRGLLGKGIAPSYYLEGMLWNVPNEKFGGSYQSSIANALTWLNSCDHSKLVTASQLHWLVRDGQATSWPIANFNAYLKAAIKYWDAN